MLEYSLFLFSTWISIYFRNTKNFDYYYYHRRTNEKGVKQQTKRCTDIKEIECKLNEKRYNNNNTCEMQNIVEFEGKRKFYFTIFIICSILLRILYYLSLSLIRALFFVSILVIDQFEWLRKYKAHNYSKSKRQKRKKLFPFLFETIRFEITLMCNKRMNWLFYGCEFWMHMKTVW